MTDLARNSNFDRFDHDFIKHVEDGIEYRTHKTTGRSGMSYSGLARTVGVKQPTVTYWVQKVSTSDPIDNSLPECFKPLAGKSLKLIDNFNSPGSEDILVDEFCGAMILYYASFAAPKDQTLEAKLALMICNSKGLRAHIQEKTRWNQSPLLAIAAQQEQKINEQGQQIAVLRESVQKLLSQQEVIVEVIPEPKPRTSKRASVSHSSDEFKAEIARLAAIEDEVERVFCISETAQEYRIGKREITNLVEALRPKPVAEIIDDLSQKRLEYNFRNPKGRNKTRVFGAQVVQGVLDVLSGKCLTADEVAKESGFCDSYVRWVLRGLWQNGQVERVRSFKKFQYKLAGQSEILG